MTVRKAFAHWQGNLSEGKGMMNVESGAFEEQYSFSSRFESGKGTNPEELIGAAHAGCYSMALANLLDENNHKPEKIETIAEVELKKEEQGFKIDTIYLKTAVYIADIDKEKFNQLAEKAKQNCPVSRALQGVNIELNAHVEN